MRAFRPLATTALALGLALGAGSAFAQSKQELVAKVLELQKPGIEQLGSVLAGNTSNGVLRSAGRYVAQVPEDKREQLAKDLQEEVRKFFDEVSPTLRAEAVRLAPSTVGKTYEEKFTEDELKTLIAWLESPVNKKFQQVAQDMQQSLGQKLIAETKPKVEPRLKKLEDALKAKISAAAAKPAASGAAKK